MIARNGPTSAGVEQGCADFLARYPAYANTSAIDEMRAGDFARLDQQQHVYLDYTGGAIYPASLVRQHAQMLDAGVFGNPHSSNPTSSAMTARVERARRYVLDYFRASADEYIVVFTQNSTAALKLIAESFPFESGARLLLTFDNHNSVNGMREFARAAGAAVDYVPLTVPELRIDRSRIETFFDRGDAGEKLFVFPAQSNFSGVKHPLDLIGQAQSKGWKVMLDAAAFVPTSRLDLGAVRPDFVCLSFYKMFGYPTGVGALLIRRSAFGKLRRPWFAGGTVNFASVNGKVHVLAPAEAAFEDGTLNYLSIPAVENGLRYIEAIGVDTIGERVRCLTGWMLEELLRLHHSNGVKMVRIYGPITTQARGGTLTLNLYDPDGHLLDYRRIEELAGEVNISLRTGCFCNPGAGEMAEQLTEDDVRAAVAQGSGLTLPVFLRVLEQRGNKSAGSIRVSFGLASNFADAWRFRQFIAGFRDQSSLAIGGVSFDIASCRVVRDGS